MGLIDLLPTERILPDLKARTKEEALAELLEPLPIRDRTRAVEVLLEREGLGSTGIGDGVAFPHGKLKHLEGLMGVFGRSKEGVDFASLDGAPVHLFFLLLAPEGSSALQLKALARIARFFRDPNVREELFRAGGRDEIHAIFAREEDRGN